MEWIVMIISRVLTTLWNEALGKLSASLSVDDQVERQQLLMMMLLLVLSMLLQQFSSPELMLCFALAAVLTFSSECYASLWLPCVWNGW